MKKFEQFIELIDKENITYKMFTTELIITDNDTKEQFVLDLSVMDERTFHIMTAFQYEKGDE